MTDTPPPRQHSTLPPEAWRPARRLAEAVLGPVDRFLRIEAASGILLIAAAGLALVWANSPLAQNYDDLFHTPIAFGVGNWRIEESLHFWINELLMTIFFLVVGLEIKREIVEGALSDMQRAALPIAAAIGGMLVPAAVYLALNPTGPQQQGWGVPMATDIAFAVGVLTLLGKRVPAALRVLLLALAIIDDIGAILVIAIFYSSDFAISGIYVAAAGLALIFLLYKLGVRPGMIFAIPLLIMWAGMLQSGVHPTIAGVIAGLMAPTRSWFGRAGAVAVARAAIDELQNMTGGGAGQDPHHLVGPLKRLDQARKEALSPALQAEIALHPWVAWGIMPVFALANAGVPLGGVDTSLPAFTTVTLGITLGLLVGKPLGVLLFSWVAVKLRLAVLPADVTWGGVVLVGGVAGIGFTMAIFIAELAFSDPALLSIGKLAVLEATLVAATLSLLGGRLLFGAKPQERPEFTTAHEVEASREAWMPEGAATSPKSVDPDRR